MVFSQTTPNTHSILKVVEIDRLKPEKNLKNLQANGSTVITGGKTGLTPPSPVATTSYSEVREAASVSTLIIIIYLLTLSNYIISYLSPY